MNTFEECPERKYELWANKVYLEPFCKNRKRKIDIVKTLDPYDDNGDFLIRQGKKETFLEVKAERQMRENLALEHWSDKGVRAGWIITSTTVDLLYLVGGDTEMPFYIHMKMQELKEWFENNRDQYKNCIREPFLNRQQPNQTFFYAIPIKDLENSGLVFERYNVKPKGRGPK